MLPSSSIHHNHRHHRIIKLKLLIQQATSRNSSSQYL
ncbi:hypothetical protein BVRB_5g125890 [Beta vulgaris subsp. vulgaris]|uniref:Uncharacterized protein n=1 Tax=Beta vulgaris subsp. vulgaris TaxID=3555 RepID=A0A0J8E3A3_BETVV|nr:hypothetical protein BVRB_5g125890 [Beta vulgaris subsp. vulgaris]